MIISFGSLTYWLARFVHHFSKLLEGFVFLFGFTFTFGSFYVLNNYDSKILNNQLAEKMNNPKYSIYVAPKITPFSKKTLISFSNKEDTQKIVITIDSQLDVNEIFMKIEPKKISIDKILE